MTRIVFIAPESADKTDLSNCIAHLIAAIPKYLWFISGKHTGVILKALNHEISKYLDYENFFKVNV